MKLILVILISLGLALCATSQDTRGTKDVSSKISESSRGGNLNKESSNLFNRPSYNRQWFGGDYSNFYDRPGFRGNSIFNQDRYGYNSDNVYDSRRNWDEFGDDVGRWGNRLWERYAPSNLWERYGPSRSYNRDNYGGNRDYPQQSPLSSYDPFGIVGKTVDYFKSDYPRPELSLSKYFRSDWIPSVDIKESDKLFLISLDLPGVTKENLKMRIEDSTKLIVEGERQVRQQDLDTDVSEVKYGKFIRSFNLPTDVDVDGLKARLFNGILEITVPRRDVPGSRRLINID